MNQRLLVFVVGLALGLTVVVGGYLVFQNPGFYGTEYSPPQPAAEFNLKTDRGPVKLSEFRDRVVVIYFGYTFCPDVCPATIAKIKQAIEKQRNGTDGVQMMMISVDPERDTPEMLGEYMRRFDPTYLGLSGSPEQIAEVAGDYGIYYNKREVDSAVGYLVDHTPSTLVIDKQGQLRLLWSYDTEPAQMAQDLKKLLAEK